MLYYTKVSASAEEPMVTPVVAPLPKLILWADNTQMVGKLDLYEEIASVLAAYTQSALFYLKYVAAFCKRKENSFVFYIYLWTFLPLSKAAFCLSTY